jgi:hypothetical protein
LILALKNNIYISTSAILKKIPPKGVVRRPLFMPQEAWIKKTLSVLMK